MSLEGAAPGLQASASSWAGSCPSPASPSPSCQAQAEAPAGALLRAVPGPVHPGRAQSRGLLSHGGPEGVEGLRPATEARLTLCGRSDDVTKCQAPWVCPTGFQAEGGGTCWRTQN